MSDSKEIVKQKFIEHFLFDYTDKDEFEIQMLSEIFEGIYYQKDKHFKPESKYWQVFRCLQDQQVEINQHQLEIHALGEANLNQAMMLAKKQEEIDSLKAQLKKWKGQSLAAMLHGACQCGEPWESVVSDKEGFNQLHCFNCNHDRYENKEYFGDHEPKTLRGEHE